MMTATMIALMLAAAPAKAAPAEPEPERPWAVGVPKEKQNKAIALFRDGNNALKESLFPAAAAVYREALTQWDHPAIHYNLALALVNLDQPVEVHDHLTAALKFGTAPLDEDKFQQAQRYLALIERQLTKVRVTCTFAGANVRLDGRTLFTAPGKWDGLVRAGPHTFVASQEGLLPDERSVVLAGGDSKEFVLRVYRTEELTEYKRAFNPAIPWATLGAGAAAVGAGLALHFAARDGFRTYDTGVGECAGTTVANAGCIPTPALQNARGSATGLQNGAVALYAVGGAAVAASAVLFYIGRPVAFRKSVQVEAPTVTVVPLITPGLAGAMATLEF